MSHETFIRCDNRPKGAACESRVPVDGPHVEPSGWLSLRRRRPMTAEDVAPFRDKTSEAMLGKFREIASGEPKTAQVLDGLEEIFTSQEAARYEGQTVTEMAIVCPDCQKYVTIVELLASVEFTDRCGVSIIGP